MKKITSKIALCLLLLVPCVALPTFTGCQSPPTTEAVIFYSFKDSWTLTKKAYDSWNERVVQGLVKPEAEAKVDAAWNKYRAAFKVSLAVVRGSQTASIPASLLANQQEILNLIASFNQ